MLCLSVLIAADMGCAYLSAGSNAVATHAVPKLIIINCCLMMVRECVCVGLISGLTLPGPLLWPRLCSDGTVQRVSAQTCTRVSNICVICSSRSDLTKKQSELVPCIIGRQGIVNKVNKKMVGKKRDGVQKDIKRRVKKC